MTNFGEPKVSAEHTDFGKMGKLAHRVDKTMSGGTIFPEPKQIEPRCLIVSRLNRDGAPPNVPHVHQLLKSFKTQGFSRNRPQIGICVEIKSEQGKQRLIEYNKSFSMGSQDLPPIDEPRAMYATLAGSHFNIALRCIKAGTHSPIGDVKDILTDNSDLVDIVENGHRWWVLSESVPDEEQVDVSMWRNQDQNSNQGTHEIELLQNIKTCALDMLKNAKDGKVKEKDLIARAGRRNPSKIPPTSLMALSKFSLDSSAMGHLTSFKSLLSSMQARWTRMSSQSQSPSSRTSTKKSTSPLGHSLAWPSR